MCSASKRLYTYDTIDVPPEPRTRRAAEERGLRIPTPAERRPALWWRTPIQVQTPNKGSPLPGRRRRKRRCVDVLERGGVHPSLYRAGGGGCHPPPLPHVGLNSQGEGGAPAIGGDGPHPW